MKTLYGYDPYILGIKVDKIRPVGEFWCWCIYEQHGEPKASFNCEKGVLYCHKCKKSANVSEILRHTAGHVEKRLFVVPDANASQIEWQHFKNFPLALNNQYLIGKRHLTNEIIQRFEIKERQNGVLIPLFENGTMVGIVERKLYGKVRYIFYGKVPPLFPDVKYDANEPVYLVEGVFGAINAIMHGIQAYCIFGTNVSNNKIKQLENYDVIGAFDNDYAGHIAAVTLLNKKPGSRVIYPGIEADESDWKEFITTYRISDFKEIEIA